MYAVITLSGTYRETAPQAKSLLSVAQGTQFRFDSFYKRCQAIREDRKVTRVLVQTKADFTAGPTAALEEIRAQLAALSEAGKELFFYTADYHDQHLYLASACDHRLIHPLGDVRCLGLARNNLFFKQLLDRYGITVQIARRGKYKSAADRFRIDSIDDAVREEYQRWLDVSAETLHRTIINGYAKSAEELDELTDGRVLSADEAVQRGWCSRSVPIGTLLDEWKQEKAKQRTRKVPKHVGRGKRVAVLVFEGAIAEGKNRQNPLLGQTIGSDSYVPKIDALAKDKRVAAVVFRVNSGGGSAVASEDIRGALTRLAGKKPLVVSMGQVAGSGGYWISMAGATVLARATTLTGSIGVITLSANIGAGLRERGVTESTLRTHPHADAMGAFRALSDDEYAQLDRTVESIYQRFLQMVAESRGLSVEQVHEHAQGRVWAGVDAQENGLIDQIGGLPEAIHVAKQRAGIDAARIEFHPTVKQSFLERMLFKQAQKAAPIELGSWAGSSTMGLMAATESVLADLVNRPLLWMGE